MWVATRHSPTQPGIAPVDAGLVVIRCLSICTSCQKNHPVLQRPVHARGFSTAALICHAAQSAAQTAGQVARKLHRPRPPYMLSTKNHHRLMPAVKNVRTLVNGMLLSSISAYVHPSWARARPCLMCMQVEKLPLPGGIRSRGPGSICTQQHRGPPRTKQLQPPNHAHAAAAGTSLNPITALEGSCVLGRHMTAKVCRRAVRRQDLGPLVDPWLSQVGPPWQSPLHCFARRSAAMTDVGQDALVRQQRKALRSRGT